MTIRALIEAVERGVWPGNEFHKCFTDEAGKMAYAAFNGSLDAALALHKALLPDTRWVAGCEAFTLSGGFARIVCGKRGVRSEAFDQPTPARAFLLAILRAVEANDNN